MKPAFFPAPGCYAFQLDGRRFSSVLAFRAEPYGRAAPYGRAPQRRRAAWLPAPLCWLLFEACGTGPKTAQPT